MEVYYKITNFKHLCGYGVLYTQNKVQFDPEMANREYRNLYEYGDHIHYYMAEMNRWGFLTVWSSPSVANQRYGGPIDLPILQWKVRDQKADVFGWMTKDVADKVYQLLKDDNRISIECNYIDGIPCRIEKNIDSSTRFKSVDHTNLVYIQFRDREFHQDEHLFKRLLAALIQVGELVDLDSYPDLVELAGKASKFTP